MDDTPNRRPRRRDDDLYDLEREVESSRRDRDEDDRRRPRRDRDDRYEDDRYEDDRPRRRRHYEDEEPRRRPKPPLTNPQMDALIRIGIGIGLVLLVLFGIGLYYVVGMVRRAPFRAQMASYLAPVSGARNPAGPRQAGKMVVVNFAERDLDDLHFDLPDNRRAGSPAEVATVVWVKWHQATVGIYKGGGTASQWSCDVQVIDRATWTALASQKFVGSAPPQSFVGRRGQSRSGDKPKQQVMDFLLGFGGR